MEPIKFEKNIKERFSRRKLQPSDSAWGKLEDLLDNGEQSKKRNVWAYGVAVAVVAGILVFSNWNFGTEGSQLQPTVISDTETSLPEHKESTGREVTSKVQPEQLPYVLNENSKVVNKEKVFKEQLNEPPFRSQLLELENMRSGNRDKVVLLSERDIQTESDKNRDAEADSLLSAARQELTSGSTNTNLYRIDANQLLTEAENELDHSFREQVLDKLKDGYKKVKGTLADRNN